MKEREIETKRVHLLSVVGVFDVDGAGGGGGAFGGVGLQNMKIEFNCVRVCVCVEKSNEREKMEHVRWRRNWCRR